MWKSICQHGWLLPVGMILGIIIATIVFTYTGALRPYNPPTKPEQIKITVPENTEYRFLSDLDAVMNKLGYEWSSKSNTMIIYIVSEDLK